MSRRGEDGPEERYEFAETAEHFMT